MKNNDVGLVVTNANLLCSMEKTPFKIARRAKDLSKVAESIITKLKEITDLGAEKIEQLKKDAKKTPKDELEKSIKSIEEEIEAERKEFLEKEVEASFDKCLLEWFDDIPNVAIPYYSGNKQQEFVANSHAIIDLLIEKGFIV